MFDKKNGNSHWWKQNRREQASKGNPFVGGVGTWLLHLVKVTFLVYSGFHGVQAALKYAGTGDLAKVAQILGIVVIETVLFGLYLAFHNQKITGSGQSVVAGVTYAVGFALACLGIVADSQIQADVKLAYWLEVYLHWGLPIAPAFMALGAVLVHELAPDQVRGRREALQENQYLEMQFEGFMRAKEAELAAKMEAMGLQVRAREAAARKVAEFYESPRAQAAIEAAAMRNAPLLLAQIGIPIGDVDTDDDGQVSREELVAWSEKNPEEAEALRGVIPLDVEALGFLEAGHGEPLRPSPKRPGNMNPNGASD